MEQPSEALSSEPEMTLAQWGDMSEDEPGELVDGRLVEEEEVGLEHDVVLMWLGRIIGNWLASRGGIIGASDTRFGVSRRRGRKPDTYVYLQRRKLPRHGLVTVPPDIMIEIVSPTPKDARRDRIEKMREYAAFGVRFYWIVDPALRSFEIFELLDDGRYAQAVGALEGVVERVPGCEGLTIDLDALWGEIDRLEPEGGGEG